MNKQGELIGGIRDIIRKYHNQVQFADEVPEILTYLHSQGVVLRVDKELPEMPKWAVLKGMPISGANGITFVAQQDMLKAGYVAVEPLIDNAEK